MRVLHDIRCRLGWHTYGSIEGDDRGAHKTCSHCGHVQQFDTNRPPEMHDHLGL